MPSLELGCGPHSKVGDVGVDIRPGPAVDLVHDLNQVPWPLDTSSYERVICLNVLEHLVDVVKVMEEIHRVAAPGGVILIRVPTGSSSDLFTDPTHIRGFGYHSFDYFVPGTQLAHYGYSNATFAIQKVRFERARARALGLVDRVACAFANAFPTFYESRLTYIYPMTSLYIELVVLKAK